MSLSDILYYCFDCSYTFSDYGLEDLECTNCGSCNVGSVKDSNEEDYLLT